MYKIVVEIPEGWGGYFSGQKMEIPGRGGLREIPSVVGVWIFSGTTVKALVSGHPRDGIKMSVTGAGRLREWFS